MIVSTVNVNGIRAAVKQRSAENLGLLPWLKETTADVVCLQETRADDEQLADTLAPALADGWNLASADPHLKGRNGVAVLSRHPITRVLIGPRRRMSSPLMAAIWRSTPAAQPSRVCTSRPAKPRPTASSRRSGSWRPWPPVWRCYAPSGATPWCAGTGTSGTANWTSRRGRPTRRRPASFPANDSG